MATAGIHIQSGDLRRRVSAVIIAALIAGPLALGPVEPASARDGVDALERFTRPQVLTGEAAQLIVRVRGGANCSGTPLSGGTLVVTAAHCVLDDDGEVGARRTVVRDGITYDAASVLVNPGYHNSPGPRLDAAVLVITDPVPGPSVSVAKEVPTTGLTIVAGFQPLDADGSLLRGSRYDDRPQPSAASGSVVEIESGVAGCVGSFSYVEHGDGQMKVPCGLVSGASGGGSFIERDGKLLLVGVISTVAHDLTYNGLVPLSSLRALLENADFYAYTMEGSIPSTTTILRS